MPITQATLTEPFPKIRCAVRDKRRAWKAQRAKIERQVKVLEEQSNHLKQKRRQYSWQQAENIIGKEELRTAFKQIRSEESVIGKQIS
ncbi:hypothetical protein ACFLT8_01115 [Chloroflexota bacterium]